MFKRSFIMVLLLAGLTACENEELPVEFLDINDTGVATFTMENETGKDVASFNIELTYLSEDNRTLKIDTVNYSVKDKSQPFVKAEEQTYLTQEVPDGTTSATGKVLNYQVME